MTDPLTTRTGTPRKHRRPRHPLRRRAPQRPASVHVADPKRGRPQAGRLDASVHCRCWKTRPGAGGPLSECARSGIRISAMCLSLFAPGRASRQDRRGLAGAIRAPSGRPAATRASASATHTRPHQARLPQAHRRRRHRLIAFLPGDASSAQACRLHRLADHSRSAVSKRAPRTTIRRTTAADDKQAPQVAPPRSCFSREGAARRR